jgi:hypothetical protein
MSTYPADATVAQPDLAAAWAAADQAVAEGRWFDAIDGLQVANRGIEDPAVELRLVRLRDEAYLHLDAIEGRTSWPPSYPDLFPGTVGLPEVSRAELTTDALGSGITHHGALCVRGFLPAERVARLVDGIEHTFDAFDAWDQHQAGWDETAPWFDLLVPASGYPEDKLPRPYVRGSGGVWLADSPRMLFEVIEAFEELGLGSMIGEYLGERPAISAKKWTLRRVPVDSGSVWHQDGAFMGAALRTVNVWVALSDCGGDDSPAPSLDVVPRRFDELVETGTHGAPFSTFVGVPVVEREAGELGIQRPRFAAGDALLFDDLFLHATGVSPGMTEERYAIEAWFFAPSSIPFDQVPMVY